MGLRIIDKVNNKILRQAAEAREKLLDEEARHWAQTRGIELESAKVDFRSKVNDVKSCTLNKFNQVIEKVDEQIKNAGLQPSHVQSELDIDRILDLLDGSFVDSGPARGL